jgi:predicted kinase
MDLIIIAGMPASGKSTAAAAVSKAFGYPIIEKDNIKEGLFEVLGFESNDEKKALDIAANEALLRVLKAMMKSGNSVILDNNFDTASNARLRDLVGEYRPNCVTVFLSCDPETLYERYCARDLAHKRHLGHVLQDHYPPREGDDLEYTMTRDEFDQKFFKRGMAEFSCPGDRIDVDTTDLAGFSPDELVERIRTLLGKGEKE